MSRNPLATLISIDLQPLNKFSGFEFLHGSALWEDLPDAIAVINGNLLLKHFICRLETDPQAILKATH